MNEINPIDTLNDLLNTDMSNVDTSYPALVKGIYEWTISDFKQEQTSKGGYMIEMLLSLNTVAKSTAGADVQPGYKLTHRIGLSPTEKYTPDMIKRAVAALKEAVFGDKNAKVAPEDFIGKSVLASCTPKESPEYGIQTNLSRFVPKKA